MDDGSSMASRWCTAKLLRCIILPQFAGNIQLMRAIILAAGQGSRLLPLTADRPKCLIDFSGRSLDAAWPALVRLPLVLLAAAATWSVLAAMVAHWQVGRDRDGTPARPVAALERAGADPGGELA